MIACLAETAAWIALLLFLLPVLTFLCVKLGTAGYLQAKRAFGDRESSNKGDD